MFASFSPRSWRAYRIKPKTHVVAEMLICILAWVSIAYIYGQADSRDVELSDPGTRGSNNLYSKVLVAFTAFLSYVPKTSLRFLCVMCWCLTGGALVSSTWSFLGMLSWTRERRNSRTSSTSLLCILIRSCRSLSRPRRALQHCKTAGQSPRRGTTGGIPPVPTHAESGVIPESQHQILECHAHIKRPSR